jgi:spoIIIJ-associated protein
VSEGIEVTGKTVEAAIAAAEEQFGISRDALEIQVLSRGSRGVFGLGGEPARILVRHRVELTEPAVPSTVKTPSSPTVSSEMAPPASPSGGTGPTVSATLTTAEPTSPQAQLSSASLTTAPMESEEALAATARDILEELLQKMGFQVEVSIREGVEPLVLDVSGERVGLLIGRHGDSLVALQFMLNLILSRRFRRWPHVVIDIEGYRARRERSLRSLALRVAQRVRRNRRAFTLEAMPANDRRIIHLTLKNRSDVQTYSIGEGSERRVVVAPRR